MTQKSGRLSEDEKRRRFAARQAQKLRRYAQYVLVVDGAGRKVELFANPNYRIGVLAVLGPVSFGAHSGEALWFEIGVGVSGPYRKSYGFGPNKTGVGERTRFYVPTQRQLKRCLSGVEEVLIGHTHSVRSGWKSDIVTLSRKSVPERKRYADYVKGVRFHVAIADTDLLRVVVQSEMVRRQKPGEKSTGDARFDMQMAAKKISSHLAWYGQPFVSREWLTATLRSSRFRRWRLEHVFDWLEQRNLPPHRMSLLWNEMRGKPGEELFLEILSYKGVDLKDLALWEEVFAGENTPCFSRKLFVYCPPHDSASVVGRYKNGRRKRHTHGRPIFDRFTFEVIPREATKRDSLVPGARTVFLPGVEVPF